MTNRIRTVPVLSLTLLLGLALRAHAQAPTITGKDGGEMLLVPAGEFVMGSGDGSEEESPPHVVVLSAYYIDRHEVTCAQYARFLAETGARPPLNWNGDKPAPKRENDPVTDVSWFDAMHYAVWAGKRLPTEAEWEKAARGTDGRRYPWGNADGPSRANVDTAEGLHPVGEYPAGASPYGCLDMGGNAWEWTADWFDAYPGTSARSVHFGRQYKVVRGGGAIQFYGVENSARCTARTRLVPYGDFDTLGFRCVQDVEPGTPPYKSQERIIEAEKLLQASLHPPVTLPYEKEFAGYIKDGRVPLTIVGAPGQEDIVRTGIPFPLGALKDTKSIRATSSGGTARPTQSAVLETWDDGSPRWVLVDFPARAGEACELRFRENDAPSPTPHTLKIVSSAAGIDLDTGVATATIRDGRLCAFGPIGASILAHPMEVRLKLMTPHGPAEFVALPADKAEVEEAGPLHGVVRLRGGFAGPNQEKTPFRYTLRIHAWAGSPRLNLLLTLVHAAQRHEPYHTPAPVIQVAGASVSFDLNPLASQVLIGGDRGVHTLPPDGRIELLQPDEVHYTVTQDAKPVAAGTRAAGWLADQGEWGHLTLGVRHFWQNHPKALLATDHSLGVELWAGKAPFAWEAGLAKTHEIVLDLSACHCSQAVTTGGEVNRTGALLESSGTCVVLDPLRATMAPAWACGSEALGPLLPRGREAIEQFPYWELMLETAKRNWIRSMPSGMRDFGDAYFGGPYKGKNAYTNLEYDVPYYYFLDFLKTGQTWYLEAAEVQVRHQVDVDIDNLTGMIWKHSPLHTTEEAEFGHVFIRGVLLHYLITGERRSLDVARQAGDWMAPKVQKLERMVNGRQIGWPLYCLSALYEVTREPRYLEAAAAACGKLAGEQLATGRFDLPLRWDDRITFFNGIATSGMLSVYQLTHDESTARAVLATARRMLGFYPEYACRTLNTFCWAAQRTGDPRYLDAIERTWRTSLAYLIGRNGGGGELHAWQFTCFAAKHQLFPLFEKPPEALPDPATWKGLRLSAQRVELYLRGRRDSPSNLLLILEGLSQGRAELLDPAGVTVRTFEFKDEGRPFQPAAFSLAPGGGTYRLRLQSDNSGAWQLHYDAGTRVTVRDAAGAFLSALYPRATGFLREGAKEIKIRLEVIGEGFYTATLFDPGGNPVAAVRHFVDLGDPGRYELELKAPVDDRVRGWGLEISGARVMSIEGLSPYWARDANELFNPERSEP